MNTDVSRSPVVPLWIPRLVLGLAGALAIYAVVAAPEIMRNAERLRAEQIQQGRPRVLHRIENAARD